MLELTFLDNRGVSDPLVRVSSFVILGGVHNKAFFRCILQVPIPDLHIVAARDDILGSLIVGHYSLQGMSGHKDGSARVRALASVVNQLESLPGRHIHQLRIDAFDQLLLDSTLDVCEDFVVFDAVKLPTELLKCCLASHGSELVVLKVGLSDVFRDDWDVSLAQIVVLAGHCAREQSFDHACFQIQRG